MPVSDWPMTIFKCKNITSSLVFLVRKWSHCSVLGRVFSLFVWGGVGFSDKEVGWPFVTKLMQYCILHLYFSDLKCLYSLIKKSLVKCCLAKVLLCGMVFRSKCCWHYCYSGLLFFTYTVVLAWIVKPQLLSGGMCSSVNSQQCTPSPIIFVSAIMANLEMDK